jgi:uncharacterized protein YwgA
VLLLFRIIGGLEKGKSVDRWKLQKTAFLAEIEMQKKGIGGLDYEFLKDKDGPMSQGIYEDMDLLMRSGFVAREYNPKLTPEGRRFLKSLDELYDTKKDVRDLLDTILRSVIEESGGSLRKSTHDMEIAINGKQVKIDSLPPYYSILHPLVAAERIDQFEVPEDWQETIEIWGDQKIRKDLESTFKKSTTSDFVC